MSQLFREEAKDIFRIFVPFESVYTSVFLIKSRKLLIDCGTYASDIDEYVIPALTEIGVLLDDIQYILLTHSHTDHSGGLNALLQKSFANVKVILSKSVSFFLGADSTNNLLFNKRVFIILDRS